MYIAKEICFAIDHKYITLFIYNSRKLEWTVPPCFNWFQGVRRNCLGRKWTIPVLLWYAKKIKCKENIPQYSCISDCQKKKISLLVLYPYTKGVFFATFVWLLTASMV